MSMPSLKAVLKMFDKSVLRDFLARPSFAHFPESIWRAENVHSKVEEAITRLNKTDLPLYRKIYSTLNDIWTVAEKAGDHDYYMKKVRGIKELSSAFNERFGLGPIKLHTLSMWLNINAPKLFEDLLRRKLANSKNASGGTRYNLPTSFKGEVYCDKDALARKIKKYFGLKRNIQHKVNVDYNVIGDFLRFVIAINPMPKEEPAFEKDATEPFVAAKEGSDPSKKGNDSMTKVPVKKPDFIFITYHKKTPRKATSHFTVKAESLEKEDRDQVAQLFAETILSSNVADKNEIRHNLDGFKKRPKEFEFLDAEEDWLDTRYRGIYMKLMPVISDNSKKFKQEIYHIEVNGDVYDCIDEKIAKLPDALKTITSLFLEITIISGEKPRYSQILMDDNVEDNRPEKTFQITVPVCGEWTVKPKPSIVDEEKLVRILEAMNIFNKRGEQGL